MKKLIILSLVSGLIFSSTGFAMNRQQVNKTRKDVESLIKQVKKADSIDELESKQSQAQALINKLAHPQVYDVNYKRYYNELMEAATKRQNELAQKGERVVEKIDVLEEREILPSIEKMRRPSMEQPQAQAANPYSVFPGARNALNENRIPTATEILGIDERATLQEAGRAYRKLALKIHPDKQAAENRAFYGEAMRILNEAYNSFAEILQN